MKWAELTTEQIAAMDRTIPIVLNIGAIEQHGPLLPVETDSLIGREMLNVLDEQIQDQILILPQVSVCCSSHHMNFAGSLTVRHETMLAYVCDIVESVIQHGFKNIILFNSHGGNLAIGQVILEKLGSQHPDCDIFLFTWWKIVADELREIQESGRGGVGHACEFETSLVAYFAEEYVAGKEMPKTQVVETFDWAEADMLNAPHGTFYRNIMAISGGTGIVGSPEYASAEKGRKIVQIVVQKLERIICDIRQVNNGTGPGLEVMPSN